MSRHNFIGDQVGVVLVHGYIRNDMDGILTDLMGSHYSTEVWCEGGYLLTVVSNIELDDSTAMNYATEIYSLDDDIQGTTDDTEEPVLVGIQAEPIEVVTEDDTKFMLLGAMWGYEDDGISRYQE